MDIITNEIDVFATDAEGFVAFKNFSAEVSKKEKALSRKKKHKHR